MFTVHVTGKDGETARHAFQKWFDAHAVVVALVYAEGVVTTELRTDGHPVVRCEADVKRCTRIDLPTE